MEAGICYKCTCPFFNHYHYCKHSLCLGLHLQVATVPLRLCTKTAGKRKARAGASLSKRSRCLEIDV